MGHRRISVIASFLAVGLCLVHCQNIPTLDWQFDPYSTDQWFKQKLDHYDSTNIQHWPQRYVTSYRFYRLGGPIFLFLSGPGPELTLTDIETGAIAEYAEEQGAFVIGLEHRFYGKSQPTSDLSTANLKFLTIPQTIEDIAAFLRSWRSRDEFRNSKWVVFGASYLGSLAAWFSQKHPELIDAFVASSAPLELRYEIPEFLENVGSILNETNPKCYDTVAEGFSCLSKVFNEEDCHNYTLVDVKEKFEFCADLDRTRPLDATGVFAELFSTINAVVMYHDPSPDSFPDTNLDRFCKHITADNNGESALEKIAEKVKEINKHRDVPCAEFRFQTTVDFLKEKEWDSPAAKEGYRQLQWQLCNELGWTVASANISQPFGNYLTPFLHSEICQNLFDLTETEMRLKVLKANTDLKGKALNTQCGIFVNGDKDPWHSFSITTAEEAGKCNRAILIEGGSHGRDVEGFAQTPSHPPQVRQAQLKIAHYLNNWLKSGSCCDEDSAESKRVISTLSRPARTPNPEDFYYAFNNLLKTPSVNIKPRSYPTDNRGKRLASPTSIPYQVSTTDVLSVSPRIPVVASSLGSQDGAQANKNLYRDPENIDFRRYRVVKLLRHRPSFAPPTQQPRMAPSMEQFEADFPEHSIRVEGRVERVFKNGTVIKTTETPSMEANEQLDLFDKGRRLLQQTVSSNDVTSGTPSTRKEDDQEQNKSRFRYVVKQVFKDVVSAEATNSTTQEEEQLNSKEADAKLAVESQSHEQENEKSIEVSSSPKRTAKREQSLEDDANGNFHQEEDDYVAPAAVDSSTSVEGKDDLSTSASEQQGSSEDQEVSKSSTEKEESKRKVSPSVGKRESGEIPSNSYESSEDDSISTSESIENTSIEKSPTISKNKSEEVGGTVTRKLLKSKTSREGKNNHKSSENSYEDDDDYDDEYYDDDDYYDDEYEDDEDSQTNADKTKSKKETRNDAKNIKFNKTTKATVKPVTLSTKVANFSTEYSSGEDMRPRRLREKISEKIMSSSESVEGDQKSKEKTKQISNGKHTEKGEKGSNKHKESFEDFGSTRFSSQEDASGEDYNYSLEPSGSNPKGSYSYRKKQLAPITKPVIEEPSTIINVEISGSYPKRSQPRKKVKKAKESAPPKNNSTEEDTEKRKRRRKAHHRRTKINPEQLAKDDEKVADTSPSKKRTKSTTTTSTTTTPAATSTLPELTDQPPTNNYASWNRDNGYRTVEAAPVQQEAPTIVNLDDGSPFDSMNPSPDKTGLPSPNNNDVMYIIIGDIPVEDNPNTINDNPSHEDLFNFIQKLVNRHSPGVFSTQSRPAAPPPTTTTTTTQAPPLVSTHGFHDRTGKYLLVRPVQVVSLGRDHVVHAQDLKNESLIDLMTMETPIHPYPYQSQVQNYKRQNSELVGGYGFKSPLHRDHFQRLLSVDGQVRDSDRDIGFHRHVHRKLDEIPDPSWRSIRGVSQFGPVLPSPKNPISNLLGLSAADTMWVNEGVPFLPRSRQVSSRSQRKFSAK